MRMPSIFMSGFLIAVPVIASAQAEFSGTQKCDVAKPQYAIPVSDEPKHIISLSKDKCTWAKAEIGGAALKEEEDVIVSELRGGTSHDKGYGVAVLASGDKVFVRFKGTTAFKDTIPQTGQGKWKFADGTGKLKGIKGNGTYTGQFNPDGTSSFEIKGKYQLKAK